MPEPPNIERFLRSLVEKGGSDLHIKSGSTPKIRINGRITDLSREILSPQSVNEILNQIMIDHDREAFAQEKEIDFIYEMRSLGRFRFNVYRQMMGVAIAVRHFRIDIPSFEELHLPSVLYSLVTKPNGLILVTGASGSGKSMTLAAMIETLNQTSQLNIITIEDPVEFAFREKRCSIQQREIGRDTASWKNALERVVKQDPDVIMLSEIRDSDTMMMALSAANTGHLVLSSMQTMDAVQAINRLISLAPLQMFDEVRYLLASSLLAVVSQKLLVRSDAKGRIPAVEVLIANDTVKKMIKDAKLTGQVRQVITDGFGQQGMQTFDQSLAGLHQAGLIKLEEALKYASSPTDFRTTTKGVKTGMDWSEFGDVSKF